MTYLLILGFTLVTLTSYADDPSPQLKILQNLTKGDWTNYLHHPSAEPFIVIKELKELIPASNEVQKLRIEALGTALREGPHPIGNLAAKAIIKISGQEQDEYTQELILKNCVVDWDIWYTVYPLADGREINRDYLFSVIKAVRDMVPASPKIQDQQIEFLTAASKSYDKKVRIMATTALCKISGCSFNEDGKYQKPNGFYEKLIKRFRGSHSPSRK